MTDKEKIEMVKDRLGVTWKEMAERSAIKSPQTFQDIRSGKISLSPKVRAKLIKGFPELNEEWLAGDTSQNMMKEWSTDVELRGFATSPKVNLGNLFPDADVVLSNNESPLFPKGAMLVLQRIKSIRHLLPGQPYAVETTDGTFVRKIKAAPFGSDRLEFEDANSEGGSFSMLLTDVTAVYAVSGYMVSLCNAPIIPGVHEPT